MCVIRTSSVSALVLPSGNKVTAVLNLTHLIFKTSGLGYWLLNFSCIVQLSPTIRLILRLHFIGLQDLSKEAGNSFQHFSNSYTLKDE